MEIRDQPRKRALRAPNKGPGGEEVVARISHSEATGGILHDVNMSESELKETSSRECWRVQNSRLTSADAFVRHDVSAVWAGNLKDGPQANSLIGHGALEMLHGFNWPRECQDKLRWCLPLAQRGRASDCFEPCFLFLVSSAYETPMIASDLPTRTAMISWDQSRQRSMSPSTASVLYV